MGSWLNSHHDILGAKDTGDWVHATGNGLSESDKVWLNARPLRAEHLSCASNTGLDLVADEENVVLLAECLHVTKVAVIWDNDTGLALNWFNDNSSSLLAELLKELLDIGNIVVADGLSGGWVEGANAWDVWTIVVSRLWVGRESNSSHCASVEVLLDTEDQGLALLDALALVCPLSRNLNRGLDGLSSGVHWENHVVAEDLLDLLGPFWEDIVMECAGGEGEAGGLVAECLDQFWMAVALVDSRIGLKR